MDNENGEGTIRIFGGLIGIILAKLYSWTLLSTKLDEDDTWYFSLVWGMESPFEAENELRKKRYSRVASDEESDTISSSTLYTSQMDDTSNLTARKADFKLRLPYTLNHSK
jgi:hypothetical protein